MINLYFKKIKKLIEFIYMKKFFFSQKQYKINSEKRLNYVFQRNVTSKDMIIVFSACTRVGVKGRYNYIRTIKNIRCNKLFILDDFGYDNRGLFYLGEDNKFEVAAAVKKLISEIATKYGIDHRIYVGSSKGGYAALYLGLDDIESTIIAGAPQYYLRFYLNDAKDERRLRQICGNDEKAIEELDYLIKKKINGDNFAGKIYLHYSSKEHTYKEHIVDLLEDIRKSNIKIETEEKEYENHSDVGVYFPDYLLQVLREIKG